MTGSGHIVSSLLNVAMCHNGQPYTVGFDTPDALWISPNEISPNACLTAYSTREGILPCR